MKRNLKKYGAPAAVLLLLAVFAAYKLCVLNIVWETVAEESEAWRECVLPAGAVKVVQAASQAELIGQSMLLVVPLIVIFNAYIIIGSRRKRLSVSKKGLAAGFLASFLLQPLHELLHGIAFPAGSTVYIGMIRGNFSGYAFSTAVMTLPGCAVYYLLPALVMGILPLLFFLSDKEKKGAACWFFFGFALIGLVQTAPDWFGLYPVLAQAPRGALTLMSGWDSYWFIP